MKSEIQALLDIRNKTPILFALQFLTKIYRFQNLFGPSSNSFKFQQWILQWGSKLFQITNPNSNKVREQ